LEATGVIGYFISIDHLKSFHFLTWYNTNTFCS